MNFKIIFQTIAKAVKLEAGLLLLPVFVALYYREACYLPLLITAAAAFALGCLFSFAARGNTQTAFERESFVMVSLVWIIMSVIGAVPFTLSGEIPSFVDALFETVSGFTTTGATILTEVEVLSKGLLFWRSLTHWIGGMGILVFIVMLGSKVQGRSMAVLQAEMPGPIVGKLVPRASETAKVLYIIYIVMSFVEMIMLCAGGMPLFESAINTMSTAGTGGFAIHTQSLQDISAYSQWVIAAFMLLFGINFNLYFFMIKGNIKEALKSDELRWYLVIFLTASGIVALSIRSYFGSAGETIRHAVFQVTSLMTTTGFSTTNYNLWPAVAKSTMLILMFIGGCAGSTAGGLKISRIIIIVRAIKQELISLVQPRRVSSVAVDNKVVNRSIVMETNVYFALYAFILTLTSVLIMLIEPATDMVSGFSAVTACFSNVGPGFGTIGPSGNFAHFTDLSKILLSVIMITGRLEIYPILLTLTLPFWKKK